MRILVLGGEGKQGRALRFALQKLELGGVESVDAEHAEKLVEKVADGDHELVFSCLPYHLNLNLGKVAIDNEKIWCDLGGHVQTTNDLRMYARQRAKRPVATDLGLAPGLIECLAYKHLGVGRSPETLNLYCGGLPISPKSAFGWSPVFSIDGVVNEYLNDCKALVQGVIIDVTPMGDLAPIWFGNGLILHAANTSGALSESFLRRVADKGVKNCRYRTLRYPGHWELVRDVWSRCEDYNQLADWTELTAQRDDGKDVIYIALEAGGITKRWRISGDGEWSAMQRGTAFPAAAVVKCLLEEEVHYMNLLSVEALSLKKMFWQNLNTLLRFDQCQM